MLKALMWKELREQRLLALTGLGVSALLPLLAFFLGVALAGNAPFRQEAVADTLRLLVVFLVWPLFAAGAGATAAPRESGAGTIGFLLSRPVRRAQVWLSKVGAALLSTGIVILVSLELSRGFDRLMIGRWGEFTLAFDSMQGGEELTRAHALSLVLVVFAAALVASPLMRRPLTAALSGFVGGIGIVAAITYFWTMFAGGRLPQGMAFRLVLTHAIVIFVLLLVASLSSFLLRAPLDRRLPPPATCGVLSVLAAAVVVAGAGIAYANTYVSLDSAGLRVVGFDPERGFYVSATQNALASELWWVSLDGAHQERRAFVPTYSPDGSKLAYTVGHDPWFRSWANGYELRIADADGSDDRLLLAHAESDSFRFSPDGDKIATRAGRQGGDGYMQAGVAVIGLGNRARGSGAGEAPLWIGSDTYLLPASGAFWHNGDHLDDVVWSADGRSLFFETTLGVTAYDLARDESRVLYRVAQMDLPGAVANRLNGDWEREIYHIHGNERSISSSLPFFWQEQTWLPSPDRDGSHWVTTATALELLDVATGQVTEQVRGVCGPTTVSPNGELLTYWRCLEGLSEGEVPRLRVRELASGGERELPVPAGYVEKVRFSPSGRYLMFRDSFASTRVARPVVIGIDGGEVSLPFEWMPYRWLDDRRLVVTRHELRLSLRGLSWWRENDLTELGILDVETGEVETIWP